MNPILSALSRGYSPNQVLRYISEMNPEMGATINAALMSGHTITNVLNYLSQTKPKAEDYESTTRIALGGKRKDFLHEIKKSAGVGLALAAAGAGAYGLMRSGSLIPEILPALPGGPKQIPFQPQGQLPFNGAPAQITQKAKQLPFHGGNQGNVTPFSAQSPISDSYPAPSIGHLTRGEGFTMRDANTFQPPIVPPQSPIIGNLPPGQAPQSAGGVIGNPIPSPSGNIPIAAPQPSQMSSLQALSQSPHFELFKGAIRDYPPNVVSAIAKSSIPPEEIQQIEQATGKPIDQVLEEAYHEFVKSPGKKKVFGESNIGTIIPYEPSEQGINQTAIEPIQAPQIPSESNLPQNSQITLENQPISNEIEQNPLNLEAKEPKAPPNVKSNLVITPSGKVAEVENESKGISSVKVGDETKKFKSDALEKVDPEIAQKAYEFVQLSEEDRSAAFEILDYSPERREAVVGLNGGKGYIYTDVSPDDIFFLSEGRVARTEGRNPISTWFKGKENSKGSAYHDFRSQPKYGKQNKGITYFPLSRIVDANRSIRDLMKREDVKIEGHYLSKRDVPPKEPKEKKPRKKKND